ncbi:MAG: hypothetical protein M3P06_03905 [Acidobacteriota bacterium]|nr:hypothetical protein [Acidobacteriota bacterium]
MRFTARHFFAFGSSDELLGSSGISSQDSWDRLRLDERETHFSIPISRPDWLRLCAGTYSRDGAGMPAERARDIIAIVRDLGLKGVCSFGVGGAYLEYNIKKEAPDLFLSCSDYTCGSIERLQQVFTECDEIRCLDLEKDALPVREGMLYLLSRIETEFSNPRWKAVFRRLSEQGAEYVLMVPNNYLTRSRLFSEISQRIRGRLAGKPLRFAGYMRTRDALQALWARDYQLIRSMSVGHNEGLLLKARNPGPASARR